MKKIIMLVTVLFMSTKAWAALSWSGTQHLDVPYKTVDGQTLLLDIYLPDTAQASPVVIYTHGGGWSAGDKSSVETGYKNLVALNLLNEGVAVVTVDYRLASNGAIIRDCITDSKDAFRFIAKYANTYNIDKLKMAAFGDSAGGHIAMMCAVTDNDEAAFPGASELAAYTDFEIKGCVSWYGPTSFRVEDIAFWMDRNMYSFDLRLFGDETDAATKDYLREIVSPVVYMDSSTLPLYLMHGVDDTTIPVGHVPGMQDKATQVGNTSFEYQEVENATHNFVLSGVLPISPTSSTIVTLATAKLLNYLGVIYSVPTEVQIRKRNSLGYCLNGGGGGVNAQNVNLWSYIDGHVNLTWEEIDRGDGYYSYQKKGTNYSLDGGNFGANNQNVYLWATNANNYNQHWRKVNMGDGYYQLQKRNSLGHCINGGSFGANNQNVNLWSSNNGSYNLQWQFEY